MRAAASLAARDGNGRAALDRVLELALSKDAESTLAKNGTSGVVQSCVDWAEARAKGFEPMNNMEGNADAHMRVQCRTA